MSIKKGDKVKFTEKGLQYLEDRGTVYVSSIADFYTVSEVEICDISESSDYWVILDAIFDDSSELSTGFFYPEEVIKV